MKKNALHRAEHGYVLAVDCLICRARIFESDSALAGAGMEGLLCRGVGVGFVRHQFPTVLVDSACWPQAALRFSCLSIEPHKCCRLRI